MKSKKWIFISLLGIFLGFSILTACPGTQERSSSEKEHAPIVEPDKYRPKSNR